MKYKIISDVHKYGPHELKNFIFTYEDGTVYLEDNYDLKNCGEDELDKAIYEHRIHVDRCNNKGIIRVIGNHEKLLDGPEYFISNNVLFTHGYACDTKWENKKENYFKKPPTGAGFFKRIGVKAGDIYRDTIDFKFSKNDLEYIYQYVKKHGSKNVDTICMGHHHPHKVIDTMYKNLRIVCVPRGESTVEL